MRDISDLTARERLDLEYYEKEVKTKKNMSRKAMRIFEYFQNNPFSMDVGIYDSPSFPDLKNTK